MWVSGRNCVSEVGRLPLRATSLFKTRATTRRLAQTVDQHRVFQLCPIRVQPSPRVAIASNRRSAFQFATLLFMRVTYPLGQWDAIAVRGSARPLVCPEKPTASGSHPSTRPPLPAREVDLGADGSSASTGLANWRSDGRQSVVANRFGVRPEGAGCRSARYGNTWVEGAATWRRCPRPWKNSAEV